MNIRRLIDKNQEIWSVQPEIENAVLISFPVVNSTVDCNINVAVKRAKKELVEMIAVYSWIKKNGESTQDSYRANGMYLWCNYQN